MINNAGQAVELVDTEGRWRRSCGGSSLRPGRRASSAARWPPRRRSQALAKDLKRHGWRFVGPTTVYAFMQAMGLVNDHLSGVLGTRRGDPGLARTSEPRRPRGGG